jgi:heme o synthase
MMGTKNRALSISLVSAPGALVFGFALSGLSLTRLWLATNALSALLAAATIASYVLIYPRTLDIGTAVGCRQASDLHEYR